jgi:hypothetical protein
VPDAVLIKHGFRDIGPPVVFGLRVGVDRLQKQVMCGFRDIVWRMGTGYQVIGSRLSRYQKEKSGSQDIERLTGVGCQATIKMGVDLEGAGFPGIETQEGAGSPGIADNSLTVHVRFMSIDKSDNI